MNTDYDTIEKGFKTLVKRLMNSELDSESKLKITNKVNEAYAVWVVENMED